MQSDSSGGRTLLSVVPIDLLAVAVVACGTLGFALSSIDVPAAIQVVFGFAFVFVAPGYGLASALFPRGGGIIVTDRPVPLRFVDRAQITSVERFVLAVGLSVALVPLVGLGTIYAPWAVEATPLLGALAAVTLLLTAVGAIRRWQLPPEERFRADLREPVRRVADWAASGVTRRERALDLLLVVGIALTIPGVVFAAGTSGGGEAYTEFYLLTEEDDGPVADGYEAALESGDLHVGLTNQEGQTVEYTVVVERHRMTTTGGELRVAERTELDRFEPTVAHGETWEAPHEYDPANAADPVRVTYLLYVGDPPEDADPGDAYRQVHAWESVED